MVFLRRLAHVSVIALFVLVACNALAQPAPKVVPKAKNDSAVRDMETRDELVKITAELRAIREQQATIEAAKAKQKPDYGPPLWSNWLLFAAATAASIAAVMTLKALKQEIVETGKAASAARDSADTAANELRLAVTPVVEIAPSDDPGGLRPFSTSEDNQRSTYALRMQIMNVSPSPVRILRIDWNYVVHNETAVSVQSKERFTLGSGRSRTLDILIEMSAATRKIKYENGIMIRLSMMLELNHPITGPFWHTHEISLHQFGGNPTIVQDSWDYAGYRGNEGQSKPESQH